MLRRGKQRRFQRPWCKQIKLRIWGRYPELVDLSTPARLSIVPGAIQRPEQAGGCGAAFAPLTSVPMKNHGYRRAPGSGGGGGVKRSKCGFAPGTDNSLILLHQPSVLLIHVMT
jgi:hypothetical protein